MVAAAVKRFTVLLLALWCATTPVAADAATADVSTPDQPAARARVVVAARDGYDPAGYRVVSRQPNLGTFTIDADDAAVARLRRDPRVVGITAARELRPALAESAAQIHAEAAWNSGLTGTGQTIAVIDTGIDATHPMLSGHVVDEACFTEVRPSGGGSCPNGQPTQIGAGAAVPCASSGCDHGTHVASIAAGRANGGLRGIASDASVLSVQVFTPASNGPSTNISEVLAAFEWVYEQRSRFAIAAINLSVASAVAEPTPCADDAVEQAVQRLRAVGIAVVAAAGNSGATSHLSYPACVPGVVSVSSAGATGRASSFANRAPHLSLFAPGEFVVAAAPGNATVTKSGTSQAAPHVAGALAAFRQGRPTASVDELVRHLDRTADTVVAVDGQRAAAGMLRVDRALDPRFDHPSVTPSRSAPPIVALRSLRVLPGRVEITGTVVDPASVLPATVTAVVDGRAAASALAVDEDGDRQQFTVTAPIEGGRTLELCVDVRGARAAAATRIVCTPVTGPDGPALGALDVVEAGLGMVAAHGWAIDPNASSPVDVHFYVDGVLTGGSRADRARVDVGTVHPDYGAAHGYSATFATTAGSHLLCAYAIDTDDDENALIGCRTFEAPVGAPFGALDSARVVEGTGTVLAGWAIDPDTRAAIDIHVYVDGRLVRGDRAARERRDVDAAHPLYAPDHGFELAVPQGGSHVWCAYGINVEQGVNALLGCRAT